MSDKIRKRLDRVTQLDSRNLPKISGRCVINGIERAVAAFEVPKGTKASEFEKVLLEQAYTEREYKLMDWMQGAGQ
ncbi:hypothetical protein ACTXMF_12290 [Psychrobacter celer]|uniref:hypothetical protein n=1 Tax=Psychrobacter celer TaxID=306572 RepID=UPI003FD31D5A